jgi:hypothetical protein
MHNDLRRRRFDADARPEIDPELNGRLARIGEQLGIGDGADADVELFEIGIGDGIGHTLA